MATTKKPDTLPMKDLSFDRQNPRLAEYDITASSTDDDVLAVLWEAMDVRELVQSIAASGFFTHEPLIVTEEVGKQVVIEGNRRLAAVKVLLDTTLAKSKGWDVPALSKESRKALETLPVIHAGREEAWRYLGFKHVNGPAKWSSYAKAKYIADVHRTYTISLEDIANQIGDRHKTVQRLYRGLMVIEQAEREKVYDREDRFRQRFAFSHLYTGLDYDGVSSFLSLTSEDAESDKPVPKEKLKELGEVCVWLYGSKKSNTPPVVESQNPHLRQLDAVLKNREAVAALRSGTDLAKAFEISLPTSRVFEDALLAAKRDLTTARGHLTAGYDKSEALLRIAGTIAEMAEDIYSEMDRKRNPGKKRRLTEE
ncbi:MAG: ParB N-terminal domain-containing protein [Armatimonadetes bacterium]|nr:ParB N-terminal domain-containing protein [Armatimonadota bacterium]